MSCLWISDLNIDPEIIQKLSRGDSKVLSPWGDERLDVKASGCVYDHSNCDAVSCTSLQPVSPVRSGDYAEAPRICCRSRKGTCWCLPRGPGCCVLLAAGFHRDDAGVKEFVPVSVQGIQKSAAQ